MKLKQSDYTVLQITEIGKISITQWSEENNDFVSIFLTLDQFHEIDGYIFKNRDEIQLKWNEGVQDDSNS